MNILLQVWYLYIMAPYNTHRQQRSRMNALASGSIKMLYPGSPRAGMTRSVSSSDQARIVCRQNLKVAKGWMFPSERNVELGRAVSQNLKNRCFGEAANGMNDVLVMHLHLPPQLLEAKVGCACLSMINVSMVVQHARDNLSMHVSNSTTHKHCQHRKNPCSLQSLASISQRTFRPRRRPQSGSCGRTFAAWCALLVDGLVVSPKTNPCGLSRRCRLLHTV